MGRCSVDGCDRPSCNSRGWCNKHYLRWYRHGDLHHVDPHRFSSGAGNPRYVGDLIRYTGAHDRVRRLRGSPAKHSCAHCPETSAHWAYDHTDPAEQVDPRGRPYSTDPDRYMPLCVSCHKRFDLARTAS